ncbi:MAG: hypothetical protein RIR51_307 [Bacteroidota bacterium]|jgi:hypothetical protein
MKLKFLQLTLLVILIGSNTMKAQTTTMVLGTNLTKSGDVKLVLGGPGQTTVIEGSGGKIVDTDGDTYLSGKTNFTSNGVGIANTPYSGNYGPLAEFYNLTVNHSGITSQVLSTGHVFVKNHLVPTAGTLESSFGALVMKSSFSGVTVGSKTFSEGKPAVIASSACTSGTPAGAITGNITVERPISNYWVANRLLTPGVTPSGTIKSNWQEGAPATAYENYGMFIFGDKRNGAGSGFDALSGGRNFPANASTIYNYNTANQSWNYILNSEGTESTNAFGLGKGVATVVYGDRRYNDALSPSANESGTTYHYTTLRTEGTLNQCDYTFTGLPTDGTSATNGEKYALLGNPFWGYISFAGTTSNTAIEYTGIKEYIYWDPTKNGTSLSNRGGYTIINLTSLAGTENLTVNPGQAFFVSTISNTPTLTFHEEGISTTNTNDLGYKAFSTRSANVYNPYIKIDGLVKLAGNETYNETPFSTVRVSYSDKFSNDYGVEDSRAAFKNSFENLVINNIGNEFVIEGRKPVNKVDTIQLGLSRLFNGGQTANQDTRYAFRINTENLTNDNLYVLYNKVADSYSKIPSNSNDIYSLDIETGKVAEDKYSVLIFDKSYQSLVDYYLGNKESLNMVVYPNPSADYITIIDKKLAGSKVEIVGNNGKKITSHDVENSTKVSTYGVTMDVRDFSNGAYFVRLISSDGEVKTSKFIKQ